MIRGYLTALYKNFGEKVSRRAEKRPLHKRRLWEKPFFLSLASRTCSSVPPAERYSLPPLSPPLRISLKAFAMVIHSLFLQFPRFFGGCWVKIELGLYLLNVSLSYLEVCLTYGLPNDQFLTNWSFKLYKVISICFIQSKNPALQPQCSCPHLASPVFSLSLTLSLSLSLLGTPDVNALRGEGERERESESDEFH